MAILSIKSSGKEKDSLTIEMTKKFPATVIIIMKIIYIAPNPLKSSRRFTKSVTATLHYRSSTIKYMYKHIHSSCILMNQKKLKYKDGT